MKRLLPILLILTGCTTLEWPRPSFRSCDEAFNTLDGLNIMAKQRPLNKDDLALKEKAMRYIRVEDCYGWVPTAH